MAKNKDKNFEDKTKLQTANQQLKTLNQQLTATEQQLRATNQQLRASGQQLKDANQQIAANKTELQRQNEFLNTTINSLGHPFIVINANDYTVKLANSAANHAKLTGKMTCYKLSHNQDKPCSGADRSCMLQEIKKTKKAAILEHVHYDRDGNRRNVEVYGHPVFDDKGNVSHIIESCIDITKRKQAEKERENLKKFPSENPNPVLRITKDGEVLYSNEAGEQLLSKWNCEVGKKVPEKWSNLIAEAFATEKDTKEEEEEVKDKVFSIIIAPVKETGYANLYAYNITEHKKTEKEILEKQKQLRSLAVQVLLSEERERRRIAEGLHDDIIQPLIFLDVKLKTLPDSGANSELTDSYKRMRTIIEKLINDTRDFTFDLSHPVLHALGLEKAVEQWLISEVKGKHGLQFVFKDDRKSKPLDDDIQTFLFKAVKELLVNVVKHAKATKVKVSLAKDQDNMVICVGDDGVGFSVKKASKKRTSFGLLNIHDRIDYLGGSFEIKSKHGSGTQAVITIPLKQEKTI